MPTIQNIEAGGEFFESTAAKIIQAFGERGVEITNGDSSGARMRRSFRGRFEVMPLKQGGGWFARFKPEGYSPTFDVTGFADEEEANQWIRAQQEEASRALDQAYACVIDQRRSAADRVAELQLVLKDIHPAYLPAGFAQDHLGFVLEKLKSISFGDYEHTDEIINDDDFRWIGEQITSAFHRKD